MSRANNRRRRRNTSQKEQNFSELQDVKALIEILVKERVEKEVHESKQQLEAEAKYFSERATATRKVAEHVRADTYIIEIVALMQRVESGVEKLQEKYDKLYPLPKAVMLDKHMIIGEDVGIFKEADMLSEEMEAFFTKVNDELEDTLSKLLQVMIEQYRQSLEEFVHGFIDHTSRLKSLMEQAKVGKQLVTVMDNYQEYLTRSQRDLFSEIAELKHLAEEPKSNDEIIHEYRQIHSKHLILHNKVRDELIPILEEFDHLIENDTRRRRSSAFIKVFIINLLVYLQWSLPTGLVLPQWNAIFAFIITGLIIVVVNVILQSKLAMILDKYHSLFKITQFSLLNHLFTFSILLIVINSLILLLYIFSLHYLYLFLYYLLSFLTETNPLLTWITNVSAIATIIVLLSGSLKRLVQPH